MFDKVRAKLGGRVRLVCSGGAPLARHVEEFLKTAMCAPCCQGYGLTETCGSSFIALPEPVSTLRSSHSTGPFVWACDLLHCPASALPLCLLNRHFCPLVCTLGLWLLLHRPP